MDDIPSETVSSEVICGLFNEAGYAAMVRNAILYQLIRRCRPKDPRRAPDEPSGTVSQSVEYFDRHHRRIAVVHRFVRPDGSIGASGLNDPKYLLHQGVLYKTPRKPEASQQPVTSA